MTEHSIQQYIYYLQEQEKSVATIEKYTLALRQFFDYLHGRTLTKEILIAWKQQLQQQYQHSTVNGKLIAINGFLKFIQKMEIEVKLLKVQKQIFCKEEQELTKSEYKKLVQTAMRKGKHRLALVIQTICATGIRVSELSAITKEAVQCGRAQVQCKGKSRIIFLPKRLQQKLQQYAAMQGIKSGILFCTRNGKPLHRGNIWAEMKQLCQEAGVSAKKVFPHNLRHLFAKTYYQHDKDIAKLADILGHCSIETTRIYIMESGTAHRKKLEQLDLIL